MEKEKVLQFLKNKGTLGVLTLCLVGATAFATYQVSYQEQQQIVEEQEDQAAEEKEASVENVQAQLVKKSDADGIVEMDVNPALMTDETGALNASDPDEESVQTEETVDVSSANIRAQLLPTVNFTEDSLLVWPAAGTI